MLLAYQVRAPTFQLADGPHGSIDPSEMQIIVVSGDRILDRHSSEHLETERDATSVHTSFLNSTSHNETAKDMKPQKVK